ncbi:MAG TPA: hypothetical protein VGG60_02655 [Candidatus Binataceae bacterium]|jgi:hypothetical protein
MSNGERDKLGEKLHDVEAARENEWARKRDQELLEKLREAAHDNEAARRRDQASIEKLHNQPASIAICPECQEELVANTDASVGGMVCPQKHGAWFGWGTVIKIMDQFAHTKK